MLLIVILTVTLFFIVVLIPLIRLFLLSCAVILIPFLIVSLTVVAPALLILPVRVLTCCLSSFVTVVSLTFRVLSILVLHGPGGMALWPPVSILLGALTPGSPLFLLQTYYHALTPIIQRSIYLGLFRLCPPLAQASGN